MMFRPIGTGGGRTYHIRWNFGRCTQGELYFSCPGLGMDTSLVALFVPIDDRKSLTDIMRVSDKTQWKCKVNKRRAPEPANVGSLG
jgi:hypothetical protein